MLQLQLLSMQQGQEHLPASYLELLAGTASVAVWKSDLNPLQEIPCVSNGAQSLTAGFKKARGQHGKQQEPTAAAMIAGQLTDKQGSRQQPLCTKKRLSAAADRTQTLGSIPNGIQSVTSSRLQQQQHQQQQQQQQQQHEEAVQLVLPSAPLALSQQHPLLLWPAAQPELLQQQQHEQAEQQQQQQQRQALAHPELRQPALQWHWQHSTPLQQMQSPKRCKDGDRAAVAAAVPTKRARLHAADSSQQAKRHRSGSAEPQQQHQEEQQQQHVCFDEAGQAPLPTERLPGCCCQSQQSPYVHTQQEASVAALAAAGMTTAQTPGPESAAAAAENALFQTAAAAPAAAAAMDVSQAAAAADMGSGPMPWVDFIPATEAQQLLLWPVLFRDYVPATQLTQPTQLPDAVEDGAAVVGLRAAAAAAAAGSAAGEECIAIVQAETAAHGAEFHELPECGSCCVVGSCAAASQEHRSGSRGGARSEEDQEEQEDFVQQQQCNDLQSQSQSMPAQQQQQHDKRVAQFGLDDETQPQPHTLVHMQDQEQMLQHLLRLQQQQCHKLPLSQQQQHQQQQQQQQQDVHTVGHPPLRRLPWSPLQQGNSSSGGMLANSSPRIQQQQPDQRQAEPGIAAAAGSSYRQQQEQHITAAEEDVQSEDATDAGSDVVGEGRLAVPAAAQAAAVPWTASPHSSCARVPVAAGLPPPSSHLGTAALPQPAGLCTPPSQQQQQQHSESVSRLPPAASRAEVLRSHAAAASAAAGCAALTAGRAQHNAGCASDLVLLPAHPVRAEDAAGQAPAPAAPAAAASNAAVVAAAIAMTRHTIVHHRGGSNIHAAVAAAGAESGGRRGLAAVGDLSAAGAMPDAEQPSAVMHPAQQRQRQQQQQQPHSHPAEADAAGSGAGGQQQALHRVRQRRWGSRCRSGQRSAAQEKGSVWNCWSKAGLLRN